MEANMKQVILSERKTKGQAALAGKTLQQINNEAHFGPNFIYRLWRRDNIHLATINRIANAIGCSPFEIMEEVDVSE